MNRNLNILILSKESYLKNQVEGIFQHVPHQIKSVKIVTEAIKRLSDERVDILLINDSQGVFKDKDWETLLPKTVDNTVVVLDAQNNDRVKQLNALNVETVDSNTVPIRLPRVLTDIYDRMVEEVKQSSQHNELLQYVVDHIDYITVIIDFNGNIYYVNKKAREWLQLGDYYYYGSSLIDYISEGQKILNYIRNKPESNDTLMVSSIYDDSQKLPLTIQKISDVPVYFLLQGGLTDVGSEVRDDMKTSFNLLAEFSDSVANVILNPLNIISGRLQLLQTQFSNDEAVNRSLSTIESQIERLDDSIRQLSEFAHIKDDDVPQRIRINETLNDVINDITQEDRQEKIAITLDLHPEESHNYGQNSHFQLLITLIAKICIFILGGQGKIHITTSKSTSDSQNYVDINFEIHSNQQATKDSISLKDYLNLRSNERNEKLMEWTIVRYLLQKYKGIWQIETKRLNFERLSIHIPIIN
ncbi:MAG: hypothetical protein GF313_13790 [Caldithrix sp.]|nr:hypothetical protein [Caldithrix sp.]